MYNASGTALTGVTAYNQFFTITPLILSQSPFMFGDFTSDPKCYYDPVGKRFIQTITEIDQAGQGGRFKAPTHVLVAVSATADPTGAWNIFSIDTTDDGTNGTPADSNCPCLGDQPLLGANADGVYIVTNEEQMPLEGLLNGAQIYAFGRTTLEGVATGSTPSFVHIDVGTVPTGDPNLPVFWTLQPATSPAPAPGTEFFVSSGPVTATTQQGGTELPPLDDRIVTWSLTGTGTLDSASPAVVLHHQVLTSEVYGITGVRNTIGATQKAGPTPLRDSLGDVDPIERLDANDSRMQQVVLANGELYTGTNTLVSSAGGPQRIGIAFFVVGARSGSDGSLYASIDHQGYVAVNSENVLYPSIGVDAYGNGAMSFTLSGPDYFPSAAFVRFNGAGNVWIAAENIPGTPRDTLGNWGTFFSHLAADG